MDGSDANKNSYSDTIKEYIKVCDDRNGCREIYDKYEKETGLKRKMDRVLEILEVINSKIK